MNSKDSTSKLRNLDGQIECKYPEWIERRMELHRKWQDRETAKMCNTIYIQVLAEQVANKKAYWNR